MENLSRLIETVRRLRAPDGCPWDRAQTHQTLRPYLIEEAYEVLDALDRVDSVESLKNDAIRLPLREELGDLLMQVLLHSEMASETQAFDIHEVARALDEKLIRRHPHVFGDQKADNADEALKNWERLKAEEKANNPEAGILDGVPRNLPALQRAARVIEKVTKVGFQWADMKGPLGKVDEELAELRAEIEQLEKSTGSQTELARARVAEELGDLFFTLANVAFLLKVSPEDALRAMLRKFESRFRHVEKRIKEQGRRLDQTELAEMDRYWNEAKLAEKKT